MLAYMQGNVTEVNPVNKPIIIPHIVNDIGAMGSGVARALYEKWPLVRSQYMEWSQDSEFKLGKTQIINVEKDIYVANMVAQHSLISKDNPTPIKYDALEQCMEDVNFYANILDTEDKQRVCEICAPKFGSLRAGGDWNKIEKLINNVWKDLDVTIYEYSE